MDKDHNLSDEDLELWYYVSRSVERMAGKNPVEQPEYDDEELEILQEEASSEDIEKLISKNIRQDERKTQLGYLKHGTTSGVDKSTAKKLTGGKFQIEATLDLHGKTQDVALEHLRYFIRNAFDIGKRGVLVITGKGADNNGVLKNQVPRWMNVSGIREYIIMFSHAQPKHGGDGALYVLLKRKR